MLRYSKLMTAALALVLLVHAPAFAGPLVYSFDSGSGLWCVSSCSISTDSNLIEPSQGYSGNFGFGPTFARAEHLITAQASGLPAHTSLSIDFLLAVIDSWDGLTGNYAPDVFEVWVDGVIISAAGYDIFNFSDQSPVRGTQLAWNVPLGFGSSWNDAAYDMASVAALHGIAHSASSVLVEFRFPNGQGLNDESFALENVKFHVDGAQVPDPGSSLLLLGMGLAGLAASRKRIE